MSRIAILIFGQALLCMLATYLISRISLIGKIGVALFYKEYKIFRSGWKTFLLFFSIQLLIILIQYLLHRRQPRRRAMAASGMLLVASAVGLIITYYDFQHTYSHRLLKERFHLGFYLFWLGWIGSCIFFLATGNSPQSPGQIEVQPAGAFDERDPAIEKLDIVVDGNEGVKSAPNQLRDQENIYNRPPGTSPPEK